MTDGNILYVSESVTSLLEHLPVSHTGSILFNVNESCLEELDSFVSLFYI